jgi:hypothetical protein
MPAGRGVANLLITDKRSDGYVEKQAWGLDFPMVNLDRTFACDGITRNASVKVPEWWLTNIHPIPELGAAILACHAGSSSLSLASWTVNSGLWKEVVPIGRTQRWLKFYDGSINATGSIVSNIALPANPTWRFMFLRSQPPGTDVAPQSSPVDFAITLNAWGSPRYKLYIPQLWDETSAVQPDAYFPTLYKDGIAVDALNRDDASRWAASALEQINFVYVRFIKDHLIISLGDIADHWIYHEDDLWIPEGQVQVDVNGGQFAFHVKHADYMSSGIIERSVHILPPDYINPVSDAMDWLGDPGLSGGISVDMETDGTEYWPKATLVSSPDPVHGGNFYTPVLYEIQATRPALLADPIATVIFDNANVPGDQGKLIEAEWNVAQDWRGSWFRAKLRTLTGSAEYDLSGNEKATLSVLNEVIGGSPVPQVTGYLETPVYTRKGEDPNQQIIELQAHDRQVRLRNKNVGPLPSFGGWSFGDAFSWLMTQCAGIPADDVLLDDDASDWLYPCPMGWLILKFDQTLDVIAVADELCKAAGRKWGIDQNGSVFTALDLADVYSGTPDYVVDESNIGDQDQFYFVEFETDIFAVRNRVMAIGYDGSGTEVMASFRFDGSLSDPSAEPFIGDDWCEVSIAPDGCDPWVYAQLRCSELLKRRGIAIWEGDGQPSLFPGNFALFNVSGIRIPASSVVEFTEKYGRISDAGAFTTRFSGFVI